MNNQRETSLSQEELETALKQPITPELILAYKSGLESELLDPDSLLVSAIATARSRYSLLPVALALRYGANPNLYVSIPNSGTMHVLPYALQTLWMEEDKADNEMIVAVMTMLLKSGSRINMNAYDDTSRGIPTVLQWFRQNDAPIPLEEISSDTDTIDPTFLSRLGVMLDRRDLVAGIPSGEEKEVLRSHSKSILELLFPHSSLEKTSIMGEQMLFNSAIQYLFSDGFEYVLERGYLPSYMQMNDLIIALRRSLNSGQAVATEALTTMLLDAVKYGAYIDKDQLSFISTGSEGLGKRVLEEYSSPVWKKLCRTSEGPTTTGLRRLAVMLSLDPDAPKSMICENLSRLSRSSSEEIEKAGERRQKIRISSMVSRPGEFLEGNIPNLPCRNRGMMREDPYKYSDLDLAVYRDNSGAVWCFTSDSFENLLDEKQNPYTGADLPEDFVIKLQTQSKLRSALDLGSAPITTSGALGLLQEEDEIGESRRISSGSAGDVEPFIRSAELFGIKPKDFDKLTSEDLSKLTSTLGKSVNYEGLPKSLALKTFAGVITDVLMDDPAKTSMFYAALKEVMESR